MNFLKQKIFNKNLVVVLCLSLNLAMSQSLQAKIYSNVTKPVEIENSFEKYVEIKLNADQITIRALGTHNTSKDGFNKFITVANGLLESILDPNTKKGFQGTELFFINVGDYPESIPYTMGRSSFLIDVGENYRGGGTEKMIFQSEEFICKLGVITRYHKGVGDYAVRRWDNPIHEIGHWVEIYGNHHDKILNSPDFNKLPVNWQTRGISEVFTILTTAWFDAQYSYLDMPENREQFKNKFPNYYSLFQSIYKESIRDIGQYCENEQELKKLDKLNTTQRIQKVKELFEKYPKSIISKTNSKIQNVIQKEDNIYKLDYSYVIDDKTCNNSHNISYFQNLTLMKCSEECNINTLCNRFGYNLVTKQCYLYANYDCADSQDLNVNITQNFEYKKLNSSHNESGKSNKLTVNEKLKMNDFICSNNKKYMITLQSDGNLCLYKSGINGEKQFVWCNGTFNYGQNSLTGFTMQSDGNFVLYKNVDNASDYIWSTKSQGHLSGYTALLQNDGNFVVYDAFYKPAWYTNITKDINEQNENTLKDCQ